MGLLDGSGMDTGTMANLALAGGLLSPGSFGQGLSTGLANANAVQSNAADLQLKRQQLAQQQLAFERQQQLYGIVGPILAKMAGGTQVPSQQATTQPSVMAGAPGTVPPSSPSSPMNPAVQPPTAAAPQGSMLDNISPDQMGALTLAGVASPQMIDLWKANKFGQALPPGYRIGLDGKISYYGDPSKGVTVDGQGTVSAMPGAPGALGAIAGATKGGEMRGANAETPIPLERSDRGLPANVTPFSSVDAFLHPPGQPTISSPAPNPFAAYTPAGKAAILADAQKNGASNITVNGNPVSLTSPTAGATAAGLSGFKTPAQMQAEALQATQDVHATTDPIIALRKDILTKSHDANQTFVNNLGDVVNNEAEIVARNNRIQPLLAQLPSAGGFGYDARVQFANKLSATGLPTTPTIAKWIAGGDPASAAAVSNQLSAAAIQTMLDTLNKEGKPNRVMYQALKEQQEGLEAGKPVLQNIMDLQNQLYQQHLGQLNTATDLMSAPDYNPVKFQSQFATGKSQNIGSPPTTAAPTMRYNATSGKIEPVN